MALFIMMMLLSRPRRRGPLSVVGRCGSNSSVVFPRSNILPSLPPSIIAGIHRVDLASWRRTK